MYPKAALLAAALVTASCVYYEPVPEYAARPPRKTRPASPVTKAEVLKLTKAGLGDDVIVTRIRVEGVESFPSADDVIELKEAGVTDRVLEAMLSAESAPRGDDEVRPRVVYRYAYPQYGYGAWSYYDPWHYGWDHHWDHHGHGHHW